MDFLRSFPFIHEQHGRKSFAQTCCQQQQIPGEFRWGLVQQTEGGRINSAAVIA